MEVSQLPRAYRRKKGFAVADLTISWFFEKIDILHRLKEAHTENCGFQSEAER